MATPTTNSTVISRTNSGFPDYLDFDSLRSSSIKYLSGLTGKVWTDYNVHDPGITILEVLIYALMDLGYRTNLPVADIFARDPEDDTAENNFFTPAEIFACNPVTITDFRKLLVDIDGVKNAWLEPATEAGQVKGLYHIRIQPDDQLLRAQEDVVHDIQQQLLTHRNLCEDFIDISLLCILKIGVSADIGLERGFDADTVGKNILLALQSFFSPSPTFYTLQQLLDKKKKIEDVFAGRPWSLPGNATHGFLDVDEFETITLKKTIHLSDVYNCILKVDGVQTVRLLQLKEENGNFVDSWQYTIPDDYVPVFSVDLSAFRFFSEMVPVLVDLKSISTMAGGLPDNSGKLPKLPDNIDLPVPVGVYHNDLADYYSIQNEFPRVYGIGDGGLGVTATPHRQAQALQLKGYLLFFDQLLANYLSQLGNIRNIFSLRTPATDSDASTYFFNTLSDEKGKPGYVPDMSKLLFNIDSNSTKSHLGYPVWKKDWDEFMQKQHPGSEQLTRLQRNFQCETQEEYQLVSGILQTNFTNSALYYVSPAVATKDEFYFCWVGFPDSDIVMTSPLYASAAAATSAIGLLPTIASDKRNYNKFSTGDGSCSFTVELELPSYAQYLAQVTEDKATYEKRRDSFLDHLLSRFAEQFTDLALLSYGFIKKGKLPATIIKAKERFLTNYPILSSTRGKGLEYRMPAASDNSSGLEKRFKAYAGISDCDCSSLCNFEVLAYEDGYSVRLNVAGFDLFNTTGVYEGTASAQAAAQSVFESLSDPEKYRVDPIPHSINYQLKVLFGGTGPVGGSPGGVAVGSATYIGSFSHQQDASDLGTGLQRMFRAGSSDENIWVSKYDYRLRLTDNTGKEIRLSATTFESEAAAFAAATEYLKDLSDATKWEIKDPATMPSGKFCSNNRRRPERFIDIDHFKIDVNNSIVGRPKKFNYDLLDKMHTFKCTSLNEFDTEKKARYDAFRLLLLMVDENNYQVLPNEKKVFILSNGQRVARCFPGEDNEDLETFSKKVMAIVNSHFYLLAAPAFASRWKVRLSLGFERGKDLLFESDKEFDSSGSAEAAANTFFDGLENVILQLINSKYSLVGADASVGVLTCIEVGSVLGAMDDPDKMNTTQQLLQLKKEIHRRQRSETPVPFEQGIQIDPLSATGAYAYRLVDRDNFLAIHPLEEGQDAKTRLSMLYNNFPASYDPLEISLGGDVTVRDTSSKTSQYHYLIRCRRGNGPFSADTVLFQSVAGYETGEEAEAAFNANYIDALGKAMDPDNYGPARYIGPDGVVFIPAETINLAGADPTAVLVATAKSYPLRKTVMEDKNAAQTYYYTLYNTQTSSYDWTSVGAFANPQDGRQAFYFFMLLLEYKGNYLIHTGFDNVTAIYIREVLAESTHRFVSEADAWGPMGVGKFICVAQSADAFHGVLQDDDSYSFTVACATAKAIHPYKYGSADKRDAALEQLFSDYSAADRTALQPVKGGNGNKYCVQVWLPGATCYPTWKSACCYDLENDAQAQWNIMAAALAVHENYRPYFDCSCYSYGIALLTGDDIIAASPQRYDNKDMLCEAIERGRRLVNCEGAYLVEHILLRTRSVPAVPAVPAPVASDIPTDTHSFIATIALPSWPERFHKKENRQLLEMILYREAPSHVLLNILWLSPEDTLAFETAYRKWRWTLLQNSPGAIDTAAASLMGLIVNTPNSRMDDCTDCLPCATKNE